MIEEQREGKWTAYHRQKDGQNVTVVVRKGVQETKRRQWDAELQTTLREISKRRSNENIQKPRERRVNGCLCVKMYIPLNITYASMVLKIEHIEDGHGYDTRERDRER